MPMHEHDAPSPADPTALDASTAAEATGPAAAKPADQPAEDSPPPSEQPMPSEAAAAPLADAEPAVAADEFADEDEDDDGPVELDDPFSGSEDAQPVMLEGDEEEADEGQPSLADMDWYILKVQSNREDSIRDTLLRRISMQGMDRWFGEVVVPKEQVTEFKGGKKRVVWRKLYPGYILVNMVLNDETWFLVRETGGIGDFTGSGGKPSPMLPQDVAKLLHKVEEKADETPKLKINFKKGDRVKINEGTFENFEGEVEQIDEANGRVTVMLSIFGRSTPVDIEYWQIETV
jgi:transcriptional antiterminator NusG